MALSRERRHCDLLAGKKRPQDSLRARGEEQHTIQPTVCPKRAARSFSDESDGRRMIRERAVALLPFRMRGCYEVNYDTQHLHSTV